MYTILHDGRTLFDPTVSEYSLEAPIVSAEANKLTSLTFTVYPNNPEYDLIKEHSSVISVYQDGALWMTMRPVYKKKNFAGGYSFKCEEAAARMDDVLHRPDFFNGTIANYISRMVTQYNALVSAANAVSVGNILYKPNEEDTFINDDYEGFWEGLVSHVVDVYGGYLIPRYTGSGIYIDYLTDENLPFSTQAIRFGENMADMFMESESEEMYTVLIPLGADVDVENPEDGQALQRPLTIASVNGGNDYLENQAGIALYGRREKTQRWESISDADELKTKGAEYLAEHAAKLKSTITLTAIDLHNLNVNVAAMMPMTRIPIQSEVHSVDTNYTATKMDINLGNPEPLQLQMGEPKEMFTDRVPKNSISKRRGGGGGGGGGRAASQEDLEHWQMIVRKENEMLWATGIKEIHESGIILDAESGVRLYNFKDLMIGNAQVVGLKGYIDVNSSNIDIVVDKTGINDLGVGETLTGKISVNSSNIDIIVDKTGINSLGADETLTGKISVEAGRINQIVSAVGSNGQVTAASIVLAINDSTSSVTISADKITLDGRTTVDSLLTGQSAIGNLSVTDAKISHIRIPQYGTLTMESDTGFSYAGQSATWKSATYTTYTTSGTYYFVDYLGTQVKGRIITGSSDHTIYYLGRSEST